MKKHRNVVLFAACVVALFAPACSSTEPAAPDSPKVTSQSSAAPATKAPEAPKPQGEGPHKKVGPFGDIVEGGKELVEGVQSSAEGGFADAEGWHNKTIAVEKGSPEFQIARTLFILNPKGLFNPGTMSLVLDDKDKTIRAGGRTILHFGCQADEPGFVVKVGVTLEYDKKFIGSTFECGHNELAVGSFEFDMPAGKDKPRVVVGSPKFVKAFAAAGMGRA